MLLMDDKLYVKDKRELESLVNTFRIFSTDTDMEFGLKNRGVLVLKRRNVKKIVRITSPVSSETQGQIVGARESLNGKKNMARRKVKNGEKSPCGQCLTRPVPNGRRRCAF